MAVILLRLAGNEKKQKGISKGVWFHCLSAFPPNRIDYFDRYAAFLRELNSAKHKFHQASSSWENRNSISWN
jgi:hypothetical protein